MPPILHCVRHGQAEHNLSFTKHNLPDPSLTPRGEKQCQSLRTIFPYHEKIDMLVSSPLRRTLYTTLIAFEPEVNRGLKVVALPEVQETSGMPCDTGSDVEALQKEFGDSGKVDLSLLPEGWNEKTGKWAPNNDAVVARARTARQWLKSRTEEEIVVVTHGGFLHYFTEDWTDSNKLAGTGWENTEFRSYRFIDEDGDNASLAETEESRERRRGTEKPLTETERVQLRETAQES